jgi:hypothetical protein
MENEALQIHLKVMSGPCYPSLPLELVFTLNNIINARNLIHPTFNVRPHKLYFSPLDYLQHFDVIDYEFQDIIAD